MVLFTLFIQDSPLQSPHDATHDKPLVVQQHICVEQGFLLVNLHLHLINSGATT